MDARDRAAVGAPARRRTATAIGFAALAALTTAVVLVALGKVSLVGGPGAADAVFYVVAYHYGFAFYDAQLNERDSIEARVGETVTLHVVPSQALPRELSLAYAERTLRISPGGLFPGDPRIREKILEDIRLGNVEHIVGIAGHPVYVATGVAPLLGDSLFREGGPRTLREAVETGDRAIKSVTFTARRVGAFDVLCIDSGPDGAGTCGWGHKWMVAKGAFVVRP